MNSQASDTVASISLPEGRCLLRDLRSDYIIKYNKLSKKDKDIFTDYHVRPDRWRNDDYAMQNNAEIAERDQMHKTSVAFLRWEGYRDSSRSVGQFQR